jgi:hypothetical protein
MAFQALASRGAQRAARPPATATSAWPVAGPRRLQIGRARAASTTTTTTAPNQQQNPYAALAGVARPRRPQVRARAASTTTITTTSDPYAALAGVSVLRALDSSSLELRTAWDAPSGERCLVVFARSFGCPFCQATAREVARDVLPSLTEQGVRLAFVGIGTAERARDFAARTDFPLDHLYADPSNACYDALGLEASVSAAFFSPQTPLAIARRAVGAEGGWKDLQAMLKGWQPWQPPQGVRQALNQGGAYLFDGEACVWSHRDPATAAHAEPSEMMARALALAQAQAQGGDSCGCEQQQQQQQASGGGAA